MSKKKKREFVDLALFSLWVDGVEVSEHYLTGLEVAALVSKYAREGHEDIVIEQVLNG